MTGVSPFNIGNITIINGDLREVDKDGNFFNTIGTVFPEYQLMIVSRGGIHADQIEIAAEHLAKLFPEKNKSFFFKQLYDMAVRLNFTQNKIIIRMDLHKIEAAFAVDEWLQTVFPKNRIQFTGLHQPEVRIALRRRGEIWRMAPAPIHEKDFFNLICQCRYDIGSGIKYLYNKHTGEHVLTYQEFLKIRPLIRNNKAKAAQQIQEIIHLFDFGANQKRPEIVFFLPENKSLDIDLLRRLPSWIENASKPHEVQAAEALFDEFAMRFAAAVGPDLISDNPKNSQWRQTALRLLYNIDEKTTAEWALGLGPEFYLNIQWLPGGRISGNEIIYDADVRPRVKRLITYYMTTRHDFISINVGSITSPLAQREMTEEEREVYIVALGLSDDRKEVRHVRRSKWGVQHRLDKGESMEQAIYETLMYRDYIIDRLNAARALGLPIPVFKEIDVEDNMERGVIPVFYFEREYVSGIVTNKIPFEFYARSGFISCLAGLLGKAAAASLVLGRKDPRTYALYFDDGDEVIQLNEKGLPDQWILIETTGSFADWTTSFADMLPHCLEHLSAHLNKALQQGVDNNEIQSAIVGFSQALIGEIQRMQELLKQPLTVLPDLFSGRTNEPKGIRNRWEGILNRLRTADLLELKTIIQNTLNPTYHC